ncbi:MAG: DUF1190 domain-containing protein [Hyphomicrobium sp.]|jgi:hypothetical protein|nr:DUF1190 domain-containing protein [Hyphomicrobium sp.]
MVSTRLSIVASTICAVALSACGNSEEPKAAAPPPEHGIFVSSSDCASTDKLTIEQCGQAIDQAIAEHNAQATVYTSLRLCEAKEGPERCDKIGTNQYRVRVQAFFVTMSDPPTAVPLYAPHGSTAAFRSPSNQELSVVDESLKMSRAAMTIANENSRLPEPNSDGGAGLGAAAADIH